MNRNSDFEDRLRRAIERGQRRRDDHQAAEQQAKLTESQLKDLHTSYRLILSEHIEHNLKRIPEILPGFRFELVYGDRGWGGAVSRDDFVAMTPGQRSNRFSRLEVTVRPYSDAHILDLSGKATVRDRGVFNRNHYEPLSQADPQAFRKLVDAWTVEFAELYSATV
jgi:hypothetical protein